MTWNQALEVCRVKANNKKRNKGGSASVSSLGMQTLKRKELHVLGKGDRYIIPFLLQKEMFIGEKDELQRGSHTLPQEMTALWELWPWTEC